MEFLITLTGTTGLIMHSSRLADPLDTVSKAIKAISGKRNKTDEDYAEMAQLEHAGSLYFDAEEGPYLPADNIWRSLLDGAKKSKRGPRVKEAVFIASNVNPLIYEGPRTLTGLWDDPRYRLVASVKVGTSRVQRTRPFFPQWTVQAHGILDSEQLDPAGLSQIAATAGNLVGMGDWRPRYGRYSAHIEWGN